MMIATTKMTSIEVNATDRLIEKWPIILGISLGVLFAIGVVLALWKTGILAKMRPYNLDEEVLEQQKRRSQARLSMRYSHVARDNLAY